jgi:hypothetical protein
MYLLSQDRILPAGDVTSVTEASSVKVACGFAGSRNWFLYFDGAKRFNGGIVRSEAAGR